MNAELTGHQHLAGQPGTLALLVAGIALTGGVAQLLAAARLRRRGDRWPYARDVCCAAGAAALTAGALATPPGGPFTAHMTQHLVTGMAAPLLLALGRPVTLVLRSLPPPSHRRLLAVLRSRPAAVLAHPVTAALLDVGGLWLLYRTPLFAAAHERPWLSALVHVHVFTAGLLLSVALCALDPPARRHGTALKAAVLVGAGGAHSVLAKTLYAAPPPGTRFAPGDLAAGAEVMYYGGDLVEIALAVAVALHWYTAGGRRLARERRRAAAPPASAPYGQ
ncbi:cytochrome c oxidase assembly protein [Streptomyces sp. NBC_00083]|uniref:cytochrome c oxidase assembly protein n=1 Tax=Streptomyces sp. NBC_00083 TaxID=2975647 RepID=UPI002250E1B4|nr:cytochrome c oxidase assembly protein [Streptomyces sp. NBC_00083]MCX5386928.1 cytochrome c oxidase assembly protein [Streptomyces sp. NBC_00083]